MAVLSAASVCAAGLSFVSPPQAHAEVQDFTQDVDITISSATLGTITFPTGELVSTFDTSNGAIAGDLTMPIASKTLSFAFLPIAYMRIQIIPVGQATGTGDFRNNITVNQKMMIKIVSLKGPLNVFNWVGNRCESAYPTTVSVSGNQDDELTGSVTFPYFAGCGLPAGPAINLLAGGQNSPVTMKLTITSGTDTTR